MRFTQMRKSGLNIAQNLALRELFSVPHPESLEVCWPWPSQSYGTIRIDGFIFLAHRLSYEHFKGPIPKGKVVRHTCDFPPCWNPEHLVLGTQAENMRDMVERGRHGRQNLDS